MPSTAGSSALTRPRPTGCVGTGSIASTRTCLPTVRVIWIAREGATIIGQYATMPVRLSVLGHAIDASWGMDVMVAPERQRQGLGDVLFRTWDRSTGASLGLGLSESSRRLFQKMQWPDVGPVPCFVKPLSRRALAPAHLACCRQSPRVVRHVSVGPSGLARPPAAGRSAAHSALRRRVHAAVGACRGDSSRLRSGATPPI